MLKFVAWLLAALASGGKSSEHPQVYNQISPLGGNQYVYVSCVAQSKISLAAIASGEQLQCTHNDLHSFATVGGAIALTLTRGAAKPEEGS